jgi:hypothetical protein
VLERVEDGDHGTLAGRLAHRGELLVGGEVPRDHGGPVGRRIAGRGTARGAQVDPHAEGLQRCDEMASRIALDARGGVRVADALSHASG